VPNLVRALPPWGAAALLFRPRRRLAPEDPVISLLGRVRAIVGLVLVLVIAVWFRSYSNLDLENYLQGLAATTVLAIPSALLWMGLLVWLTAPARRRAALKQMRWPALSLGAFVLVMVLLFLFNAGGAGYVGGRLEAAGIDLPLDGLIYGGIFGLWLVVFCFSSAYLVTQHWFNAADGHPLLAPLMAGWMAWVAAANTLIFGDGDSGVPAYVVVGLPVGSALVTTALAAAEGWRAAHLYRVRLRGGPWPTGRPAPAGRASGTAD